MKVINLRKGDVVIMQVENVGACKPVQESIEKFVNLEELNIKFMVFPKEIDITVIRQLRCFVNEN